MKELSKKQKILRISLVVGIIVLVLGVSYLALRLTGAWEKINSAEKIKKFILSLGNWGRVAFVLLQFLQVTFLPIPAVITTIAGSLIYGPLQASFLSLAGILLGSFFAFFLGKTFGRKIVVFMVGEKTCQKWFKFLSQGKYAFFIMMLLPIFPDDILCLVAGLTDMSWLFFAITNFISRPIAIFMTCYLGSGNVIPYHGWGLVVWAVLVAIAIVLIVLSIKFRVRIENFISKIIKRKSRENSQKKDVEISEKLENNSEKEEKINSEIKNSENTEITG